MYYNVTRTTQLKIVIACGLAHGRMCALALLRCSTLKIKDPLHFTISTLKHISMSLALNMHIRRSRSSPHKSNLHVGK